MGLGLGLGIGLGLGLAPEALCDPRTESGPPGLIRLGLGLG